MGILVKLVEAFFSNKSKNESLSNASFPTNFYKNQITCKIYSVKGKNPSTNRIKTVQIIVEANEALENIMQKSGLLPPLEINEIPAEKPTERQINYAKNIGLILPSDATKKDVSIFLTRYEDEKPITAPPIPNKILHSIINKGIYVPAYAGMDEIHNIYFHNIELTERIAYFGMKVYCNLKRKRCCLLEDEEEEYRKLFYEFAKKYENNNEFLKSLAYYSGDDLPLDSYAISKKLKAYDMAVDFFIK